MKQDAKKKNIASYFERKWSIFDKWLYSGETLSIHYGYYTDNVNNFKDAVYAMNDLIATLLDLKNIESTTILDAGCGVGGTSIYLGKKFPKVKFVGITLSDEQVEMGQNFVQNRNLNNCHIMKGDFEKTDFPNNYFDGIFAIESAGYSEKIDDFLKEMKRVLKPGGMFVILDGFRTEVVLNWFFQEIYEGFLYGRGYSKLDLPHLKYYLELLKKMGFNNIYHKDISNCVARSQIRGIIIGIPFFFSYIIKKFITLGFYNREKNFFDFSMAVSLFLPIIALKNISRYYLITANKGGL